MKKIFNLLILLSVFLIPNVYAATAKVSITPSSRSYVVGNTFTITVSISSTEAMAGLDYTLDYNESVLALESTSASTGGVRNLDTFMNNTTTSVSYTYKFRARASGTSTISLYDPQIRTAKDKLTVTQSKATIKVMTQSELYATYSSNNYLESLSIEGYELDPVFDKNTTEYKVSLKPETEKIIVSATKDDWRASLSGTGEVDVSEGVNTIKVDVVAENGNLKTYTIIATVEEYDPINVTVDGKTYTVVRNKKAQTLNNSLFTDKTVQIGEYEVPAFYNEITNITLVMLKDSEGNASYFIYDNNNYTKFNELNLSGVDLILKNPDSVDKNYKPAKININDIEYDGYKYNDASRYSLFYGTNIKNNNTSYYLYDNLENTLQRYDDSLIKEKEEELRKFKLLSYVLIGTSVGLIGLLIASLCMKPKTKKIKPM